MNEELYRSLKIELLSMRKLIDLYVSNNKSMLKHIDKLEKDLFKARFEEIKLIKELDDLKEKYE